MHEKLASRGELQKVLIRPQILDFNIKSRASFIKTKFPEKIRYKLSTKMKLIFCLLLLIPALVHCKIFNNCELAKQLIKYGMPRDEIATWVCIAYKESSFNSALINPKYGTYGLFQISKKYWCSPPGKGCNVRCKNLIDDKIADDIRCVKKVFAQTKSESGSGFKAWDTYPKFALSKSDNQVNCTNNLQSRNGIIIGLNTSFLIVTSGKIFDKCELASQLIKYGLPKDQIATWVCIVFKESSYNTAAINYSSGCYGLFQICEQWWCSPPGKVCNMKCTKLLDDNLADDIKCVKTIYERTRRLSGNGFTAWETYSQCKSASSYIQGCSLE
ncbi:putative C-Type lysozyme [Trypoxylus dichotomus]